MIKLPFIALGIGSFMLTTGCTGKVNTETKPNIIVILADDLGFSDIGCYGSEIRTPNIDRLANEGVRLTQFYNTGRCCPTRASLLTGMYHHKTGVGAMHRDMGIPAYQGYLNRECMTIAEMLKEAGYKTYLSGKWHVGGHEQGKETWPVSRGFDRSFSLLPGASDFFDPYRGDYDRIIMVEDYEQYIPSLPGFYMTDAINEYAARFIEEHENNEVPFFLFVSHTAPHWPLQALPEDIERYSDHYQVGWDTIRARRFSKMKAQGVIDQNVSLSERTEGVPPWSSISPEEKEEWAHKMAVYAAMIDRMDQGIGELLHTLDKKGMTGNTLVMFFSDNGGCAEDVNNSGRNLPGSDPGGPGSWISYDPPWANASNTPFRYFKSWMYEGGISTPMVARLPGIIPAGSIRTAPAHVIDLTPTFMELAGFKYPDRYNGHTLKPLDGLSIMPVLKGKDIPQHEVLFWEHLGFRAVREGEWKIVSSNQEKWKLFNLETDRSEENDLSLKYPRIVEKMEEYYEKWAGESEVLPWNEVRAIQQNLTRSNN